MGFLQPDAGLRRRWPRILLAAVAMGAVLWVSADLLAAWFDGAPPFRILALMLLVTGGLVVYAGLAFALGAVDREALRGLLRRRAKP
jgi:putative peptidoglycan lipid II flippase